MSEVTLLLSLYSGDLKKFDKAVKKSTKKKLKGGDVIVLAKKELESYEHQISTGLLRKAQTSGQIFDLIKLGTHLINKEVYRIWSGGRQGRMCSKVTVKGISITEEGIKISVQAPYSAESKSPVVRTLGLSGLGITWFLTEKECKEAICR